MSKIDMKAVEEYQKILNADPGSKVFAVLADSYREMGIIEQAENIARRGVSRHPEYAPGLVTWARILMQKLEFDNSIKLLKKAIELSPDNLLAYQLLGEAYLAGKNPKDALKAHKMALFLNPQNERSQQVVKKLESLAADEFDAESFEMRSLQKNAATRNPAPAQQEKPADLTRNLEISLSVIDALIVRNDPLRAKERLGILHKQYPGNPQIAERMQILDYENPIEERPELIGPVPRREKAALQVKINKLKAVLNTIEQVRNHHEFK